MCSENYHEKMARHEDFDFHPGNLGANFFQRRYNWKKLVVGPTNFLVFLQTFISCNHFISLCNYSVCQSNNFNATAGSKKIQKDSNDRVTIHLNPFQSLKLEWKETMYPSLSCVYPFDPFLSFF